MNSPFIEPDWPAPANVLALTTLRQGGHSRAPYASLNLADHVEDDPALVRVNRQVLAQWLPPDSRVQWLTQVHGISVVPAGAIAGCPVADACWSREPGQACTVLTADCLPVLFCSLGGDAVAAAHAGWRGLLGGVLEQTVAALDVAHGQLLAWLGPAIGPASFEVGGEVREAFLAAAAQTSQAATAACFVPRVSNPEYYFADLYALARLRLAASGVTQVFGGEFCTYSDPGRFYSYRRDGQTGRMASIILLKSA